MQGLTNTWGGLPYLSISKIENSVHPDDFVKLKELNPDGRIFQYLRYADNYIVLCYRGEEYRVKPEIYYMKKGFVPKFVFGEKVFPKNHSDRIGEIYDIMWHTLKNEEMYFIRVGNKRISKRYWRDDLEVAGYINK